MSHPQTSTDAIAKLRDPSIVMRLDRMGAFHQSRLSFMRVLLRNLKADGWTFSRPIWQVNDNGVGVATYQASGPQRAYTLIAFSHDLPDELRSDRVIAEAWDATFTLFDGVPTAEDIDRLSRNVPLQEAGRISESEFSLSRANRSVRMFNYVIDCLSKGKQPDIEQIEQVGYLMRTTAVYGAGKFGAADRDVWKDRDEFQGSFQPELLSVWLIRTFTIDLVEHLAKAKDPKSAVTLDSAIRRRFGVGNSTGLGMAPFLMNHPSLIHSWINARETALARVCSLKDVSDDEGRSFNRLVARASVNADNWVTSHELQTERIAELRKDFAKLTEKLATDWHAVEFPWQQLVDWSSQNLSLEGQEQVVSLMLEGYGDLVDDLAPQMCAEETQHFRIDGRISVADVKAMMTPIYGWTDDVDFASKKSNARVWYVSEEKLEPRLGERFEEPIAEYEQPLSPGRDASRMLTDLANADGSETLGAFLMRHPEHRHMARRVQMAAKLPFAEIRDNTIDAQMMPIDLLRCKLSFFGATKFDPRSDRWVRIVMYQGAPFPHELADCDPDDLAYPPLEH